MTPELQEKLDKAKGVATIPEKQVETPMADKVAKAKVHLLNLEKSAVLRAGEKDFNPFLWIRENIRKIEARLSFEPTDEVIAEALAMKVPDKSVSPPVKEHQIDPRRVYDKQQ